MDLHMYGLHKQEWIDVSAPTQFMAKWSNHKLCALALTEAIVFCTHHLKSPVVI